MFGMQIGFILIMFHLMTLGYCGNITNKNFQHKNVNPKEITSMEDIPKQLSSVRVSGLSDKNFILIAHYNKSYSLVRCNLTSDTIKMIKMEPVVKVYPALQNEVNDLLTGFVDDDHLGLVTKNFNGKIIDQDGNGTVNFNVPTGTVSIISSDDDYFYSLQSIGQESVTILKHQQKEANDYDLDLLTDVTNGTLYLCYENNKINVSNSQCSFQANLLSSGFVWNKKIHLLSTDDSILVFDDDIRLGAVLKVNVFKGHNLFLAHSSGGKDAIVGVLFVLLMLICVGYFLYKLKYKDANKKTSDPKKNDDDDNKDEDEQPEKVAAPIKKKATKTNEKGKSKGKGEDKKKSKGKSGNSSKGASSSKVGSSIRGGSSIKGSSIKGSSIKSSSKVKSSVTKCNSSLQGKTMTKTGKKSSSGASGASKTKKGSKPSASKKKTNSKKKK